MAELDRVAYVPFHKGDQAIRSSFKFQNAAEKSNQTI